MSEKEETGFNLNAYVVAPDGSTQDLNGRTIFFSYPRFQNEICHQGHCFVCGAPPNSDFNDEHVFPNWLLKQCGIHNEKFTLPNGVLVKYSTYKIPCCQTCNSELAKIYEAPISDAMRGGYDGLINYIKNGGHHHLCAWLALIFTKVHLRDFRNRASLDLSQDKGMISDVYNSSDLHHFHAVARAMTAGVQIDDRVFGSLLILHRDHREQDGTFDYCDHLAGRTLLLQINDVAMIYVLDDCGETASMLSEKLKILPEPPSRLQVREVYAHHLTANIHIKETPSFKTNFIGTNGKPEITVDLPEFTYHNYEPKIYGEMLASCLGNYIDEIQVDGKVGDEALEIIKTGRVSFIFDQHGKIRTVA